MSLAQYLDQMERLGINRDTVAKALWQHADYVEDHGLPPGMHDSQTQTDSYEARKYAMECKRMIQAEANKQVIGQWLEPTGPEPSRRPPSPGPL
jgi:hypothetical protein